MSSAYVENLANCTCDKMNINLCLLGFLPFLPLSESLSGFSHYTLQTDRPISVCQTSLDQKLSCDNIAGFAKKSRYAVRAPMVGMTRSWEGGLAVLERFEKLNIERGE